MPYFVPVSVFSPAPTQGVFVQPRAGLAIANGLVRPGPAASPAVPDFRLPMPCGCNLANFSFCQYPISAYDPGSVALESTPCSLSFFGPTY